MRFLSNVLLLAEKDVRLELRAKETYFSTLLFVLLVLVIFNFSFGMNPAILEKVAAGMIWVVIAFSGTIAISHVNDREQFDHVTFGLRLTGISGTTFYFAKFVTALMFMVAIEIIAIPLFMLLFNFSIGEWAVLFVMILALGTIGYAAIGTLFSAMLAHSRFRNLLLPIVFYPVIIPLLIAAVKATQNVLAGEAPRELPLLIGFDIIFLTASALLFDFVVEDVS